MKQDRDRYVAAGLTLLQAYFFERRRNALAAIFGESVEKEVDPLGSYVEWSQWVRDALLWLDQPDPVATIDISKSVDPESEQIGAVFHHWAEVIGAGKRITVKDVIRAAISNTGDQSAGHNLFDQGSAEGRKAREAFLDALNTIAAPMVRGSTDEHVCPRRLGNWLLKQG